MLTIDMPIIYTFLADFFGDGYPKGDAEQAEGEQADEGKLEQILVAVDIGEVDEASRIIIVPVMKNVHGRRV